MLIVVLCLNILLMLRKSKEFKDKRTYKRFSVRTVLFNDFLNLLFWLECIEFSFLGNFYI